MSVSGCRSIPSQDARSTTDNSGGRLPLVRLELRSMPPRPERPAHRVRLRPSPHATCSAAISRCKLWIWLIAARAWILAHSPCSGSSQHPGPCVLLSLIIIPYRVRRPKPCVCPRPRVACARACDGAASVPPPPTWSAQARFLGKRMAPSERIAAGRSRLR